MSTVSVSDQPFVVEVDETTEAVSVASPGPQGATGPTGPQGPTGATGPQGPSGVIAVTSPITNSGTSTSADIGIQDGTTAQKGAVQLEDSTSSTSTTKAATPNSVKSAYDLANTANTAAGTKVSSVTGTSPIASSGGTTPAISIQDGTTAQKGAVQLEDSTSSTSTTKAATPNSVKSAYDLANGKVSSVSGTSPISSSGGTTPAISIQDGTTAQKGAVQLTDSTSSTSTTTAATPNSVKSAYDLADSKSPVFYLAFNAGNYYSSGMAHSTLTVTLNRSYYIPFFVHKTTTFDRIACVTSSTFSGTATVRLGIYNNATTTGLPDTVLLDAGTVSPTAASTLYTITISQQLSPGIYWLCSNMQSAATTSNFVSVYNTNMTSFMNMGFASSTSQNYAGGYYEDSITGTFATYTGGSGNKVNGALAARVRPV